MNKKIFFKISPAVPALYDARACLCLPGAAGRGLPPGQPGQASQGLRYYAFRRHEDRRGSRPRPARAQALARTLCWWHGRVGAQFLQRLHEAAWLLKSCRDDPGVLPFWRQGGGGRLGHDATPFWRRAQGNLLHHQRATVTPGWGQSGLLSAALRCWLVLVFSVTWLAACETALPPGGRPTHPSRPCRQQRLAHDDCRACPCPRRHRRSP